MKSYFFYTDQLTVGYDGKPLIKEINIQLNKGEILTLIGPNGAGKSTILKSITRQLSLISGTVYLEQEQMSRMTNREVSKKLAVVLTERMRPELMTCEDVVSTGRYPYTGTLGILSAEDKEKVKSAMNTMKRSGKNMSWLPPFGYLKDPNDRFKIIIDESGNVETTVKNIAFNYIVRLA